MKQSFLRALFSHGVVSETNAERLLKCTFIFYSIPLFVTTFLYLFFPESLLDEADGGQLIVIFVLWLILAGIGWLIFKRYVWAAYFSLILYFSYMILEGVIQGGLPSVGVFDFGFCLLTGHSIRSIKFFKKKRNANDKNDSYSLT